MSVYLSVDAVIAIHDDITAAPILNRGKLEGALGELEQTWDGLALHPGIVEQAAVLLRGIASAHAFEDGNKRTATIAMITFLGDNGMELECGQRELADFVESMVTDHLPLPDITVWISHRLRLASDFSGGAGS